MAPKEENISTLLRLFRKLLETPQGLSKKELADEAGCTVRTVERTLERLQELLTPIEERTVEHGRKIYRIPPGSHQIAFTISEIAAVCTSRRFLEPMQGTELWESMESVLSKMEMCLGQPLAHILEASAGIEPTTFGWGDYRESAKIIDILNAAAKAKRRVEILHQSCEEDKPMLKKVDPYGIVSHEGSLYLIGYSHKSQGIRQWKIDRMSAATALREKFQPPPDFNLSEYIDGLGFGIYKESEDLPTHRVRIRFRSYFAQIVQEKRWHASQNIIHESDGSVILEMELSELRILKRWVMGFGRHAEVLEPTELKEMVKKELELTTAHYM